MWNRKLRQNPPPPPPPRHFSGRYEELWDYGRTWKVFEVLGGGLNKWLAKERKEFYLHAEDKIHLCVQFPEKLLTEMCLRSNKISCPFWSKSVLCNTTLPLVYWNKYKIMCMSLTAYEIYRMAFRCKVERFHNKIQNRWHLGAIDERFHNKIQNRFSLPCAPNN